MRTPSHLPVALVALSLLVLTGCAGDSGESAGEDVPDPAARLAQAADRMEEIESFAFLLEHENATTMIVGGLAMERAEGQLASRDRLRAEVLGRAGPMAVNLSLIIVPEGAWLTNPLTGAWTPQELSIDQFFDPATGVTAILRGVSSPVLAGGEVINGATTEIVEGTIDSGALLLLLPGVPAGRPLTVRSWIGTEDPVVHRIEIRGSMADGDSPEALRRLTLSQFGETFTVAPPQ